MGGITKIALRETVVDFTYGYFYEALGITSAKPAFLPRYLALPHWCMGPFQTDVWLMLGMLVVLFYPIYALFLKSDVNVAGLAGRHVRVHHCSCFLPVIQPLTTQGWYLGYYWMTGMQLTVADLFWCVLCAGITLWPVCWHAKIVLLAWFYCGTVFA
jgi:hypothetical protein